MKDDTNTKTTAKRTCVWYCAIATFPNNRIVFASITATTKPWSTFKTTNLANIYCDWCGTHTAERVVADALAA